MEVTFIRIGTRGEEPKFEAKLMDGIPCTDRNVPEYETRAGFQIKNLLGKEVLDIGAGEVLFRKECESVGVHVIALDPYYYPKESERTNGQGNMPIYAKNGKEGKVGALNEFLPFRNETFDAVVSVVASFGWLRGSYNTPAEQENAAKKMLIEVLRVMKTGGEAHIGGFKGNAPLVDKILCNGFGSDEKLSWSWRYVDDGIFTDKILTLNKRG